VDWVGFRRGDYVVDELVGQEEDALEDGGRIIWWTNRGWWEEKVLEICFLSLFSSLSLSLSLPFYF